MWDLLLGVSMSSWEGGWLGTSVSLLLSAFVTVGVHLVVFVECFRDGDPVLFSGY